MLLTKHSGTEKKCALKFDTFFSSEDYIMDDFAGWSGEAMINPLDNP